MKRGCAAMLLGVSMGVVLPAVRVEAQEGPTVYSVIADSNGNVVATKQLPDGTVVPVDLSAQGIVLDPGDVGRDFTVGGTPVPAIPKNQRPQPDQAELNQRAVQRLADELKEPLGCTDPEWDVLGLKIRAIQLLQATLGDRPMGIGDKVGSVPFPSVMAAINDLRTRTRNFHRTLTPDYPEQEIKSQLTSLRDSRSRARQELARMQKELTELVTTRQEGVLVERGILE